MFQPSRFELVFSSCARPRSRPAASQSGSWMPAPQLLLLLLAKLAQDSVYDSLRAVLIVITGASQNAA
jgi:hypothetical protein